MEPGWPLIELAPWAIARSAAEARAAPALAPTWSGQESRSSRPRRASEPAAGPEMMGPLVVVLAAGPASFVMS